MVGKQASCQTMIFKACRDDEETTQGVILQDWFYSGGGCTYGDSVNLFLSSSLSGLCLFLICSLIDLQLFLYCLELVTCLFLVRAFLVSYLPFVSVHPHFSLLLSQILVLAAHEASIFSFTKRCLVSSKANGYRELLVMYKSSPSLFQETQKIILLYSRALSVQHIHKAGRPQRIHYLKKLL